MLALYKELRAVYTELEGLGKVPDGSYVIYIRRSYVSYPLVSAIAGEASTHQNRLWKTSTNEFQEASVPWFRAHVQRWQSSGGETVGEIAVFGRATIRLSPTAAVADYS